MKPGDLISERSLCSNRSRILGMLLEEPRFPRYGNFPKNYTVLSPEGTVSIVSDRYKYIVEVIGEAG